MTIRIAGILYIFVVAPIMGEVALSVSWPTSGVVYAVTLGAGLALIGALRRTTP